MSSLYMSLPQYVEAVHWDGLVTSRREIEEFIPDKVRWPSLLNCEIQAGKDGAQDWVPVPIGHFIVSLPEDRSDIWPVDGDYFANKYRRVSG